MAKDPVCGMEVDPKKAARHTEYKGKTYYFCSEGCLKTFQATLTRTPARAEAPVGAMDAPVGVVKAYLEPCGYFVVSELPLLLPDRHGYGAVTDIQIEWDSPEGIRKARLLAMS